MENGREKLKKQLAEELAGAVLCAARRGKWERQALEGTPEEVAKAAVQLAANAWGGVPSWFGRAVDATRVVLMEDEELGTHCLWALREATEGADMEQRVAAMELLVLVAGNTWNAAMGACAV